MHWRLLAGVPEEDVRELLAVARRRTFEKGEVVFHRGDPGDSLHLILTGRFAVRIVTPLGDTALVGVHGPGGAFGELALVGASAVRSATVSALEAAETRAVFRDDFERLRRRHPGVNAVLVQLLAEQVRRSNERLVEAHYVGADTRVRRRLCELADVYGGDGQDALVIPLTQQDFAEIAGTSRATVNRVLREDARGGLLELARGQVIVLEPEVLAARVRAR